MADSARGRTPQEGEKKGLGVVTRLLLLALVYRKCVSDDIDFFHSTKFTRYPRTAVPLFTVLIIVILLYYDSCIMYLSKYKVLGWI